MRAMLLAFLVWVAGCEPESLPPATADAGLPGGCACVCGPRFDMDSLRKLYPDTFARWALACVQPEAP
jgi:hypothetical protein